MSGSLDQADVDVLSDVPARNTRSRKNCPCCCEMHCTLSFHTIGEKRIVVNLVELPLPCDLGMVKDEELADLDSLFLEDVEPVEACAHFTDVLRSLNLSL